MKTRSASILTALLTVVVLFTGCDSHKSERAALLKQVNEIEGDLSRANEQLTAIAKQIEALSEQIENSTEQRQQLEQRLTSLQDELASVVLDHKMATVALMASAGGAATIINENIDEDTKAGLRIVGVIGALYCVANSDECADVAARVLYYGSQIETANKSLAEVSSNLSAARLALQKREEEHTSLKNLVVSKTTERDELKKKHDSLMCSLCL